MKILPLAILSFAVFMSACVDPAANKPKAQTSEPSANAPAKIAEVQGDSPTDFRAKGMAVTIDADTSKIEFTGSKVTGKHDGGFKSFKGMIDLVGDKAVDSRVVVEIDMASVFTDADGLTKHLQTDDFFSVEKFPKSTFTSTKIGSDAANGAGNYTVTGDLEMRGIKKSITFPATITISPTDVAVKAEFSINRKDFGILYTGGADNLIRDEVVLRLDLKAPKKK